MRTNAQLCLLILFYLLSVCSGIRKYKLALIPKISDSLFFHSVRDGCIASAKKLSSANAGYHVDCDYIGPSSEDEGLKATTGQIEILNGIISNRTHDGVAISVNNDEELTPLLNKVIDVGIPLITFDSDARGSKRICYIGTNNTAFGDQMAKVLMQINPDGGEYGIITTAPASNLAERVNAVRNRLKGTDWRETERSPKDAKGDADLALEAMGNYTKENPRIGAILPVGSWPMKNHVKWKRFVKDHPQISYVVGDSQADQIELVSRGYGDGLVGQMPFEMGRSSVSILMKIILKGESSVTKETILGTNILQILRVPLDLPPLDLNSNYLGDTKVLNYVLFVIVVITIITFALWTWKNMKSRVVSASQPVFLFLILAGTLIMSSSLLTFTVDSDTNSIHMCTLACHLDIWFIAVGFTAVFAALFSKAWRVNIIMEHSMRFRRIVVTIKDVMLPFVLVLLANVVVLVTWSIESPLKYVRRAHAGTDPWNREFSFYGSCESEHSTIYFTILMLFAAVSLILAMYQTFKTRNYRTEFNESTYIGIVVVCICQGFLVGIPVFILTRDQRRVMVSVVSLIIFFTCMSILLFIFVPKVYQHRNMKAKKSGNGVLSRQYLKNMAAAAADEALTETNGQGEKGLKVTKLTARTLPHINEDEKADKTHDVDKRNSGQKGLTFERLSWKSWK